MFKPIWRWLTDIPKLPEEWRSEFLQEVFEINYKRLQVCAWFNMPLHLFLLTGLSNLHLPPQTEFVQESLHWIAFAIPALFLLTTKIFASQLKTLNYLYLFMTSLIIHAFTINIWRYSASVTPATSVILLLSGFIIIPNRIALIIYIANCIFLILCTLIFPIDGRFVDFHFNYIFFAHSNGLFMTGFGIFISRLGWGNSKENFVIRKNIEVIRDNLDLERKKSERLLLNILPEAIALRLKEEQESIADGFAEVTVLFADIVGFTELSARISAHDLVERLNQIFSAFDALTERHQLEKIKTIGDAYMVVGGLPQPRPDHAQAIANMAIDMCYAIDKFYTDSGEPFRLRIGISTGPVVAGVIGTKKYIYDLWGDTVNTASRMESHGIPGRIQLCAETSKILQLDYEIEERGIIQLKGKGEMRTHWLIGRRNSIT